MSSDLPSPTGNPTCADAIDRITSRVDLPLRRRQDLTSAVRRLCRLERRSPLDLAADPGDLRRRLSRMSALSSGLSPGGVRNLKSLVGKALIDAGITAVPRRSRTPLSPEWQQLLSCFADRHQRFSLSHFARYSSARGWLPAEIDDERIARYGQDLVLRSLLERPKQALRDACIRFNAAAGLCGLPQRVTVPSNRPRRALPLDEFPASFRSDLEAYLRHLAGEDLLGDVARPASPDTVTGRRKQLLALASAQVEGGRDPRSIASLADLVDPGAARAGLSIVWQRLGRRKTGYLHNLALLLVTVAKHWVKVAPDHLEALRGLRRKLDPGKGGMTEGNRRKLLQFADEANVAALFQLPERLIGEAMRRDRGGIAEAVLAQTPAAIAIELAAPLRINSLVQLDIEQHIVRSRSRPGGVVHLSIPGRLVKNRVPVELVLPPRAVKVLDLYCDRFRPRLLAAPGSRLFPGRHGHKNREGMSKQISQTICKVTGLRMHTHLFRHLAGFLILSRNPGEYETVRLLLGHRSLETTTAFYCGMEQAAAFRRYDELISSYATKGGTNAKT